MLRSVSTLIHGDASPIYQPQSILLVPPSSVEIREECRNICGLVFDLRNKAAIILGQDRRLPIGINFDLNPQGKALGFALVVSTSEALKLIRHLSPHTSTPTSSRPGIPAITPHSENRTARSTRCSTWASVSWRGERVVPQ